MHRLHRYADRVSGEHGVAIRAILPPRYRRSRQQHKAEIKLVKVARSKARVRRKEKSRRLKNDLDPISECVRNRTGCARLLGETVRHAIENFGPDDDLIDVPVDLPTLDGKGFHTGGWQTEHLRVWRFDAAWKSLASGWIPVSMRNSLRMVFSRNVDRGFVVEVLGCDPLTEFDTSECWLLEIGRTFCHAQIGQMPAEFKMTRHNAILKYRLPVVTAAMAGLIKLDQDRSSLPRNAAILGRTFVPLEEMCHAVRLGGLAINIGYQTQARELEILQTQATRWQRDDITTDQAHYSQLVIPKTSGFRELENVEEFKLHINQATMDEILDLHDLELSRTGASPFPTCRFPPEIGWKLGPGQYSFSHAGTVMRSGFLRSCLAYVTAGWPRFTLHDLRHALNEEAEDEGVEDFVRAARLGHSGLAALETYDGEKTHEAEGCDKNGVERRMHRLEVSK